MARCPNQVVVITPRLPELLAEQAQAPGASSQSAMLGAGAFAAVAVAVAVAGLVGYAVGRRR